MDPETEPHTEGARRLAGNTAWLLAGQIVSKVASLVFVVIVARAIGVREYGYFTFATSFVPLFLAFGTLGLDSAVVREVARDKSRLSEVFTSGLYVRLAIGVLALGLSMVLAPLFIEDRLAVLTVFVVGTALFIDEVTTYLSSVFKAFERMRYHASALVVNRIGSTFLALGAYLAGAGLVPITIAYFAGSLGALVYTTVALRKHFPPIDLRAARRATAATLLKVGLPLGIAGVLNMALFRLDTVMVEAFEGAVAVGLYGVAFRFFESFLFVSWSLGSITLPRYARQGRGRGSARTFDLAVAMALSFYVPIAVGAMFSSRWAVTVLFGARYVEAAQAVPWLTLGIAFYAITYQARNAIIGIGGRSWIAWIAGIALVVNIIVNLFFIPRYGFPGAAMATALACALEAGLTTYSMTRLGIPVRLSRTLALPLLAGAVMAAVLAGFGLSGGVAAGVGAGVYLIALGAAAALLAPSEKDRVIALLRRRSPSPGAAGA